MPSSPKRYLIPSGVPDRALVERLRSRWALQVAPRSEGEQAWLDTADWRIFRAGWSLMWDGRQLVLGRAEDDSPVARVTVDAAPDWAGELPVGPVWQPAAAAVAERRLLEQVRVSSRRIRLSVLDRQAKTTVRVSIERFTPGGGRRSSRFVAVAPLRGYERSGAEVARTLAGSGLVEMQEPLVVTACRLAGRPPPGPPASLGAGLEPAMPVARAASRLLSRLREEMSADETGVRQRLDVEFLHEYRVAGRRARSLLKHFREVLPADEVRRLAADLGWLGTHTGPARDLDVHIDELGPDGDDGLDALRRHLRQKRDEAQLDLVAALDSDRYRAMLEGWVSLERSASAAARRGPGRVPAGRTADAWVARAHRRVLKGGRAITTESPPEALHDLRKRAKELRYLLECFEEMYPADDRAAVVKELKALQDNLGEYQDCQVQAAALRNLGDEMVAAGSAPAATLMAMGRMADALEGREARARAGFDARFARFSSPAVRGRLEALVAGPR